MYEQHERWLEELRAQVRRDEAVVGHSGRMTLAAIAAEIVNAAADERKQTRIHIPNWESMARDIQDTLNYLGPESAALASDPSKALIDAINGLFVEVKGLDAKTQRIIDNERRPRVTSRSAELFDLIDDDRMLVAVWRDLIAACRSVDHSAYSHDRVAFLRDNVIALQGHRRQDPGHWGLITTAVEVLFDYGFSVRRAQVRVGDPPFDFDPRQQGQPTGLTLDQRLDLAERWIVSRPVAGDVVVWFRIENAYFVGANCAVHGNIAFYSAQNLASGILDHQFARQHYAVVPEELLTEGVLRAQSDPSQINEYCGFEHTPGLVYARVACSEVESHRAAAEALHQLECLLYVLSPPDDMWTILKGHLVFDGSWNTLDWGPKRDAKPWTYFGNDTVTRNLRNLNATGLQVTRDVAQRLKAVRELADAIHDLPRTEPEAIVMAAVRAIEHCNTWTTRGRKPWGEFVASYLLDEFTRTSFLRRALEHTGQAILGNRPDRSPTAPAVPQLDAVIDAVTDGMLGTQFNLEIALQHTRALRTIYVNHHLARPLAELDDILQSGDSIGRSIDEEAERVTARVARLMRSRNAAIHGGPQSTAACDSIADFARDLADQALAAVSEAILRCEPIPDFMRARRDENRLRLRAIRRSGDRGELLARGSSGTEGSEALSVESSGRRG